MPAFFSAPEVKSFSWPKMPSAETSPWLPTRSMPANRPSGPPGAEGAVAGVERELPADRRDDQPLARGGRGGLVARLRKGRLAHRRQLLDEQILIAEIHPVAGAAAQGEGQLRPGFDTGDQQALDLLVLAFEEQLEARLRSHDPRNGVVEAQTAIVIAGVDGADAHGGAAAEEVEVDGVDHQAGISSPLSQRPP